MVLPGEPKGERLRKEKGKGRRQSQWKVVGELLVNSSSLRSLHLTEQAKEGKVSWCL